LTASSKLIELIVQFICKSHAKSKNKIKFL
jgi:hypothetical protein